jgi:Uma2 family endonuclease
MGASLPTSEREYLTSSYEPDCEYDDEEILERSVGDLPHGILQLELGGFFRDLRKQGRPIRAAVETRIRIAPRKYRIPGVCVYKEPAPRDRVPSTPPFIAIEILSPEDRMSRVRKTIDEYLAFGVRYVWVIDPETRRADVYTAAGFYEAKDGVLRTEDPAIEVPLAGVFQALDD